ncbi:MAG: DNA polymerase III subunit delta' [Oscillospiraceae bacterium]|nr:DNA polymerase III subunit delta' [Oscillospiraceae bacterium]
MGQIDYDNRTWAEAIRTAASQRALSHAIILAGSGDTEAAARYAAAAHLCRAESGRPCLTCSQCRKVMEDIHPDVVWVRDTERKELAVKDIRQVRRDVYIRPNEGERKVCIFPDCRQLNPQDQNVLLKIVEEGPAYAAFIFCAPTAHSLLPTIRSRCVEMHVAGGEEAASESADKLCRILTEGSETVLQHLISLESSRLKREELLETVDGAWFLTAEALLVNSGKPTDNETVSLLARSFDISVLNRLNGLFAYYRGQCRYNVNVGMVLGAMAADLRHILRR